MATDPYDIVVGPGQIWLAPVGTAFPLVDATPAAAWTSLGETEGGTQITAGRDTKKITTDQTFAPKKTIIIGRSLTIKSTLAQMTLEHMSKILDDSAVTTVAAGSGTAGYKYMDLKADATIPQYALLMRAPTPYASTGYLQWELPSVQPGGESEQSYVKDEKTMLPVTFETNEDPARSGYFGQIKAYTAAAL
jgi:hypothetical protein